MAAVLLGGCSERPAGLERRDGLDELCTAPSVAFSYKMTNPDGGRTAETLLEPATEAGCEAPIGAWTDPTDEKAGGLRKSVYDLRNTEGATVLCCPP